MRTALLRVVVSVGLLVAGVASAQVLVGAALTALSNAGTELQATITNQMADAINQKNYDKLLDLHIQQTKQTAKIKDGFTKLAADIDKEVADLEGSRGKDPATWGTGGEADAARAKYETLKAQKEQVVKVRDERISKLRDTQLAFFKLIQGMRPEDMDRMGQQLIARQKAMGAQVGLLLTALNGIAAQQQAAASVKPIKLNNQAKDVAFIVNDVRVDPHKSAQIAMPANRVLKIRAEAMTAQRTFNTTKAAQKNTHIEQQTPWVFQFTVDTGGGVGGQTTWQVTKEEYEWSFPGNPKLPSEHSTVSSGVFGAVKNDVFVWTVPRFFEARFGKGWYENFWIATRGSIEWSYERHGSGGLASKSDKKSESFDGSGLDVSVGAE